MDIREAPEKGKANQAVIKALSDHLGVPRLRLTISFMAILPAIKSLRLSKKIVELVKEAH
jgi:uncharacterized protein YggU (UPF0235/DUF167 family)